MRHIETYVSLFSSAGVGCYGFKEAGFECVATNELIARRLDIQRYNQKCKYDSGYICGDITSPDIQKALYDEVNLWKKKENVDRITVVLATPPCQGMSVANLKKNDHEIVRNSLVIESIKIVQKLRPKFFIFENVPAFMSSICTDIDGVDKPISEAIESNLGSDYSFAYKIINFKDYGACSSRKRTLVIGVSKDLSDDISPYELFPLLEKETTLRETIGSLKSLSDIGEIDKNDIYHQFRFYPERMREWIKDLKEGESAFDNKDDSKKPHKVVDGKIVINQQKTGDKYKRQYWDKVGPCVHTRNDQLASQNTIHPSDDRVFSIRELMKMMTIPESFKWDEKDLKELNALPIDEKCTFLKKNEIKIRQSLGEAVPTIIFRKIADNINKALSFPLVSNSEVKKIVAKHELTDEKNLFNFVKDNPLDLSISTLGRIAELANTKRTDNAAFFTNKTLITDILKHTPSISSDTITILEPSVGVGNFILPILRRFEDKKVAIDVVDVDKNSLAILKLIMKRIKDEVNTDFSVNFINDDFLLHDFGNKKYDYIIGNPPFFKVSSTDKKLNKYRKNAKNIYTTNICSFFLDKVVDLGSYISFVFPKFLLNTPEFAASRSYLSKMNIDCIIDFGEKGFPGVLIETIAIMINPRAKPSKTKVISITTGFGKHQEQSYIFDEKMPYWVIYRDEDFDKVYSKMDFGIFEVFRDRQITNKYNSKNSSDVRVLRSRNIAEDGSGIIDIPGYDFYMSEKNLDLFTSTLYINSNDAYLAPNMTYKPRLIEKPINTITNGSVAVLTPKNGLKLSKKQLDYFITDEYRKFYKIARNYQTRSLNIDSCSVYFFGILKENKK
jgi:adenine/cytosine DNA methyltransferase